MMSRKSRRPVKLSAMAIYHKWSVDSSSKQSDFSVAYADQNESDHDSVKKAAQAGKLEVLIERQ
jgi:hypothetical protein